MTSHVWEDDEAKYTCIGTLAKEENGKFYYKAVDKKLKDGTESSIVYKKGDKAYLHAPKGETYLAEIDSIFYHKSRKTIGFEARWFYGPKDLNKVSYAPSFTSGRPKFDSHLEWLYSDHRDENSIEMIKSICNIVFIPSDLPFPPAFDENRGLVIQLCKKSSTLFCRFALHIENEHMIVEKLTKEKLEREFTRRYPSIPEDVRNDVMEKDIKYFKQYRAIMTNSAAVASTSSSSKDAANKDASSKTASTTKSATISSSSGVKKDGSSANASTSSKKESSLKDRENSKVNTTSSNISDESVVGEKRKSSSMAEDPSKSSSTTISTTRKASRNSQNVSISSLFDDDDNEYTQPTESSSSGASATSTVQSTEGLKPAGSTEKYSWIDIVSVPDKQGYRLKQMLDYTKRAEDLGFMLWYRKERVIKHQQKQQGAADPSTANILTERDFKLWKSLTIDTDLIPFVNMVNNWKKELKLQSSPVVNGSGNATSSDSNGAAASVSSAGEAASAGGNLVSTRATSNATQSSKEPIRLTAADYNKARRERIRAAVQSPTHSNKTLSDEDEEFSEDLHFAITNEEECVAEVPVEVLPLPELTNDLKSLLQNNCVCNAAPLTALQESVYLIACMDELSKVKRDCLLMTVSHPDSYFSEQVTVNHGLLSVDGRIVVHRQECLELFYQSLYQSGGKIKKALDIIRQELSQPYAMTVWDIKEQRVIQKAYEKYGAHYPAIRKALKTKTWKDTLLYINRYLSMPDKYEVNILQPIDSPTLPKEKASQPSSSSNLFERNVKGNTNGGESPVIDYFNLDKEEPDSKISNDQVMHPDLQDESMYFELENGSDGEENNNGSDDEGEEPSTPANASTTATNGSSTKKSARSNVTTDNVRFQQMLIKFLEWFDEFAFHQLLSTLLIWHQRILSPAEFAVRLVHILHEAVYLDSEIPISLLINAAFNEDVDAQSREQELVINAYLTKAKQCKEFFLNEFKELFPPTLRDRVMKISVGEFYPMHHPLEDIPIKWVDNTGPATSVSAFFSSPEDDQLYFQGRKTPSPVLEPTISSNSLNGDNAALLINNPYLPSASDENNDMLIDIPPELAMEWFGSKLAEENATIAESTQEVVSKGAEEVKPKVPEDSWMEDPSITTNDGTDQGSNSSTIIPTEPSRPEEMPMDVVDAAPDTAVDSAMDTAVDTNM